ncbi:MAG: DUF4010 domain-containing protein [Candidatus Dojkabacteria bacterium]|nr:MAG: DUF4010 domain-containing protein [Candidatus Dojkabacteria bacterium]
MDTLLHLLLSIFLGVIVGIDRDESWREKKTLAHSRFTFIKPGTPARGLGGVRTFTLISILGFLSGYSFFVDKGFIYFGVAAFAAIILLIVCAYALNYLGSNTLGLTTEISIFILFVLTFLMGAHLIDIKIALGIGVIISLILSLKIELRKAVASFTKREIIESLEFVLMTAVIFPWLPDVDITLSRIFSLFEYSNPTYNDIILFNPKSLWLVVIFVTTLNFIGYFLVKIFKSSKSLLLTGLLGGIVSSTTVTQLMAMKSKETESKDTRNLLVATALLANSTSFIRIPILTLALNKDLFGVILISMVAMTIIGFAVSLISVRKNNDSVEAGILYKSPLALKSALIFAALFVSVQILTQFGLILFGKTGFVFSTLLASASGLDAVAINTANAIPGLVGLEFGALTLMGAVVVNLIFKLIMTLFIGNEYFNKRLSLYFAGIIAAGIFSLIFMIV